MTRALVYPQITRIERTGARMRTRHERRSFRRKGRGAAKVQRGVSLRALRSPRFLLPDALPVELEPELNLARRARVQDLTEGVVRRIARRQTDGAGVVQPVGRRIRLPLRVIERVDQLGA